jgi:RimJ/RimL family protein N-acetyltransferase
MPTTTVTRTYLRMTSRDALRPARSLPNARIERVSPCSTDRYRALYKMVGANWHWHDRDAWPDEQLAEHLEQPGVGVYVFRIGDEIAGYVELQRHAAGDVEIVYFGLVPEWIGKGLGGAMLTAATEISWQLGASAVWLHTCTLDHPAALANYRARGFEPYNVEQYEASL